MLKFNEILSILFLTLGQYYNQKDKLNFKIYNMKKVFLSLLLGIATISFAQQAEMNRTGKMDPEKKKAEMQKKQQAHLDKLTKDLNLSQEQVKKIKTLQDKEMADMQSNMQKNKQERQARMDEMKKKHEAHDAEMKKILNSDQYQKWEADRQAKMEKRKEMMKDRAGKGEFGKKKMMKKQMDEPVSE